MKTFATKRTRITMKIFLTAKAKESRFMKANNLLNKSKPSIELGIIYTFLDEKNFCLKKMYKTPEKQITCV